MQDCISSTVLHYAGNREPLVDSVILVRALCLFWMGGGPGKMTRQLGRLGRGVDAKGGKGQVDASPRSSWSSWPSCSRRELGGEGGGAR